MSGSDISAEDLLTRKTGLNREERRERARRGGAASHTPRGYIRRLEQQADELTVDDHAALRGIVGPVDQAEVYAAGVKAGVKLAAERLIAAAVEVVAA